MNTPGEWYVCFHDPDEPHWWVRLFKKGFRHCAALGYEPDEKVWLFVDWTLCGLVIYAVRDEEASLLITYLRNRGPILRLPGHPLERRIGGLRLPLLYCVPAVKHLLGLDSWALTPWQLFCTLRKRGAVEIFTRTKETLDVRGQQGPGLDPGDDGNPDGASADGRRAAGDRA